MEQITGGTCTANGIMNCMEDAYKNHGWVSLYLGIQSLFLPQTGVAIAAACADHLGCFNQVGVGRGMI